MTRSAPPRRSAFGVRAALAALALALLTVACQPPAPAPTPDPFSGLSERADQAFREGLQLFEQGRYRDALAAFERARILSPAPDARIEQMIERTRAILTPTPTPGPPTATPVPPTPTATPVPVNRAAPDLALGQSYFGTVYLVSVPGRNIVPPPSNEFFFEEQVGLYIEALGERLRLPFSFRVFNLDTGELIAVARSEGALPTPPPGGIPGPGQPGAATRTPTRASTPPPGTPGPGGTPAPAVGYIQTEPVRFFDKFVWYQEGGERPGRYRVELYANGTMTHAFDYLVTTVPIALPPATPVVGVEVTPGNGTLVPPGTPIPPGAEVPPEVTQEPGKPPVGPEAPGGPAAPAEPPQPTPTATPTFTPTPTPTPQPAATVITGGLPAGFDVNVGLDRLYVADASGVIWTVDGLRPTLNRPFTLDRFPVDLAVDQTTGNLYVATRQAPGVVVLNGQSGQQLAAINLPANPGDLVIDSTLGLLYVLLPDQQALVTIDVRTGAIVRTTTGLQGVTGITLDEAAHLVVLSHLAGQVSVLDGRTSQVIGRQTVSTAGLVNVTTAGGAVYAVNAASRQLVVVDPSAQEVVNEIDIPLWVNPTVVPQPPYLTGPQPTPPGHLPRGSSVMSDQPYILPTGSLSIPGALAVGPLSGTVYVLDAGSNSIVRLDPASGAEVGRVALPERVGRFAIRPPQSPDYQALRPRLRVNPADETLYLSQPEQGTLSIIRPEQFPPLTSDAQGRLVTVASVQARVDLAITPTSVRGPGPLLLARAQATFVAATPTPVPVPTPVPAPTPTPLPPSRLPEVTIVGELVASTYGSTRTSAPLFDWAVPEGRFFTQANGSDLGTSRRGYMVTNEYGIAFWSAFQQMGGVDRLGFPISDRFEWNGTMVQLTQKALLQWAPQESIVKRANVMDLLHDAGLDDVLLTDRLIPPQMSYAAEAGMPFEQVRARRLALLEADPIIHAFYYAANDPLLEYGLPTSRVIDLGDVVALRTQRAVLQRWKNEMPWARKDSVTTVLVGDLVRDYGLFGDLRYPFVPAEESSDVARDVPEAVRPRMEGVAW